MPQATSSASSCLFRDAMKQRVLLFDGAMGTSIHACDLDLDADFEGRENCSEVLVRTRPDVVRSIHESFLRVGADAVETNTFGANRLVLTEFDIADEAFAINEAAARIAREACDQFHTNDRPRFVIGSIGPGTRLVTLGHVDWDTLLASYREQADGLIAGGADVLLIETCQDLLQVKCAVNAAFDAIAAAGHTPESLPVMVQVTIETTGTMLLGTEIAAAATALARYPIMSLGLNCATGPVEMAEHLTWLARHWPHAISVLPNAGLPTLVDGKTEYPLGPVPFAEKMAEYVTRCGLNIVGGCCGTTPAHIEALSERIDGLKPAVRDTEPIPSACTSLYQPVDYRQDQSILNVGERTNASGSRAFKRMLEAEAWDDIVSLARGMMREGSHLIDINVDYAGRDNPADMGAIVTRIVRQVNTPIMLDSTQAPTIEAGLKCAGGTCIINSANLEDGTEKFDELCGLAKRYGAAIVLGCIDEDPEEAMARTADRKESIAARMYERAVNVHGLAPDTIFFDPLVLPVSTGMDADRRSALETIEGTRRIAARFPDVQITCGLSNVSFGLKPKARQVLNSVFLHELIDAGMTSAILHVSKIQPRTKIDATVYNAALNLLYDRRPESPVALEDGSMTSDPLQIFIDCFHDDEDSGASRDAVADRTLEERLRFHIIDGEKQGLIECVDEAREVYAPLDIINDHLLDGMKTVGELFGSGQLQLPFVLQSAEVMKMAVAHLEPFMEKSSGRSRGSIVLATVKGDVHDIGKNLVDIILSNNGYTVHNLGIKQPVASILSALEETQADAVGLSGLLVKSVTVMDENLDAFNEAGVDVPILLGGAALARHYCEEHLRPKYRGAGGVWYGKDAFEGLRLMNHIAGGETEALADEVDSRLARRAEALERVASVRSDSARGRGAAAATLAATEAEPAVSIDVVEVPEAPFFGTRVVTDIPLREIYPYINRTALFRGQWQFRKGRKGKGEDAAMLAETAEPILQRLQEQCASEGVLQPKVVYGYFPCNSEGNDVVVYDPAEPNARREVERFSFPRQSTRGRRCISDFFRPADGDTIDVIGMSCVTMGDEVSRRARTLFENDDYAEYLYLHGMGVECAEALAELWHKRMRMEMGIGNDDAPAIRDLFTQKYRGSRYSFGYPACPDMSDQERLFKLIEPERIGCRLTENWQIDPEQSTSAIVVHHPAAKYFAT